MPLAEVWEVDLLDKELLPFIQVSEADIENALAEWETNPPDDEFTNLLNATDSTEQKSSTNNSNNQQTIKNQWLH